MFARAHGFSGSFARRALASAVAWFTLSAAPDASAVVIQPVGVRNGPVIPSNGALWLDENVGSVQVTSSAGVDVPGELVVKNGQRLWRPTEPFELGSLSVRSTPLPGAIAVGEEASLTVVGAVTPPPDLVELDISLEVVLGEVAARACCDIDAALVPHSPCGGSTGCVPGPVEPYCAPTRHRQAQRASFETRLTRLGPEASQVLVKFIAPAQPASEVESWWPEQSVIVDDDEASAREYCGTVEVWDLTDDSRRGLDVCVENPMPDLREIEQTPTFFGSIARCMLPPEGLTESWCSAMAFECEDEAARSTGADYERRVKMCTHFYSLCSRTPPPAPPGSMPGAGGGGGTGGGLAAGASGSPNPNASSSRIEGGCRFVAAHSAGKLELALLALLGLLIAARQRGLYPVARRADVGKKSSAARGA